MIRGPMHEGFLQDMSTYDLALLLLSLGVGLTFAAHGAQKAFGWWGGPGIAGWTAAITRMGFRPVPLFVALSIGAELAGGIALAIGLLTPFAAAAVVGAATVILLHVHWPKGFWNAKGGYEYPLLLGIGAAVLGLLDPGVLSVDHALGITFSASLRVVLLAIGVLGGLASIAIPRLAQSRGPVAQAH